MERSLVPGRECGTCDACCVWLTIKDPELQKAQGHRCSKLACGGGCTIYETRPQTCREYYCAWRQLKWVKVARPDQSDVLVTLHGEVSKDGSRRMGIMVTLLTKAAARSEGVAETVAAGIAAGLPVYLQVPGPPGYTYGNARINEALEEAVAFKDKAAVMQLLRRAWKDGRVGGARRPVVLQTVDANAAGGSASPPASP